MIGGPMASSSNKFVRRNSSVSVAFLILEAADALVKSIILRSCSCGFEAELRLMPCPDQRVPLTKCLTISLRVWRWVIKAKMLGWVYKDTYRL